MPRVMRTQVDVVLPEGAAVLNADDERIADMARLSDGEVILYATRPEPLADHRAEGGRAVLLRDGRIVLATGVSEAVCVDLVRRRIAIAPEVALPALATAWAMGINPELMAAGLETFGSRAVA
jgi:cyanophycin synthetase